MKLLAVLLALALPPAVYFPTFGARREAEIRKASAQLRELDTRNEQARSAQRKLDQFHAEVARLDEELVKLRAILPTAMNIDEIRSMTETRAAAHGVKLNAFDFNGKSVRASATGSASGLTEFFRDVSNAPRIIDVDYVTLRKDAAGWRSDFVMTSDVFAD